jgi:hypothetical protein
MKCPQREHEARWDRSSARSAADISPKLAPLVVREVSGQKLCGECRAGTVPEVAGKPNARVLYAKHIAEKKPHLPPWRTMFVDLIETIRH